MSQTATDANEKTGVKGLKKRAGRGSERKAKQQPGKPAKELVDTSTWLT